MTGDPRQRIDALIARALRSNHEEEAKTSALIALRLMDRHAFTISGHGATDVAILVRSALIDDGDRGVALSAVRLLNKCGCSLAHSSAPTSPTSPTSRVARDEVIRQTINADTPRYGGVFDFDPDWQWEESLAEDRICDKCGGTVPSGEPVLLNNFGAAQGHVVCVFNRRLFR